MEDPIYTIRDYEEFSDDFRHEGYEKISFSWEEPSKRCGGSTTSYYKNGLKYKTVEIDLAEESCIDEDDLQRLIVELNEANKLFVKPTAYVENLDSEGCLIVLRIDGLAIMTPEEQKEYHTLKSLVQDALPKIKAEKLAKQAELVDRKYREYLVAKENLDNGN